MEKDLLLAKIQEGKVIDILLTEDLLYTFYRSFGPKGLHGYQFDEIFKHIAKLYKTYQIVNLYVRRQPDTYILNFTSDDIYTLRSDGFKSLIKMLEILGSKVVVGEGKYVIYLPFGFYDFEPVVYDSCQIGSVLYQVYLKQNSADLNFEILCQDGIRKVHKFILEALDNKFLNRLISERGKLDLREYSCSIVDIFIESLYLNGGTKINISETYIFNLLDFADYYRLDLLFNLTLQHYLTNYAQDADTIHDLLDTYLETQPDNVILNNLIPIGTDEKETKYEKYAINLLSEHIVLNRKFLLSDKYADDFKIDYPFETKEEILSKVRYLKTKGAYPFAPRHYFEMKVNQTISIQNFRGKSEDLNIKATTNFRISKMVNGFIFVKFMPTYLDFETDELEERYRSYDQLREYFEELWFSSFAKTVIEAFQQEYEVEY